MMAASAFLLDTNIVSYVLRGNVNILRQLQSVPMDSIYVSSITLAELYYGLEKNPEKKDLRMLVDAFICRVNIVAWDQKTAQCYAVLRNENRKKGVSLSAMDLLIAAHAIAIGATMVTNDQAFLKIGSSLRIVDWTQ